MDLINFVSCNLCCHLLALENSPPPQSNLIHFHAVLGRIGTINRLVSPPPSEESLIPIDLAWLLTI